MNFTIAQDSRETLQRVMFHFVMVCSRVEGGGGVEGRLLGDD